MKCDANITNKLPLCWILHVIPVKERELYLELLDTPNAASLQIMATNDLCISLCSFHLYSIKMRSKDSKIVVFWVSSDLIRLSAFLMPIQQKFYTHQSIYLFHQLFERFFLERVPCC